MAGEKRTIDRIINFFNENSFLSLCHVHSCSENEGDALWGGVYYDEFSSEESLDDPLEKMHILEDIEELNNHLNILICGFDSFAKRFCDILVKEDSCLSDKDKNNVTKFFRDYMLSEEVNSISRLIRNIYLEVSNMEKLAKLAIGDNKDSAYGLAVKHGLLEEKDGTYTPIFEDGKKGLKNVVERWYELSLDYKIPMPTAKDIAQKISNPDGKSYKESTIGKYLEQVRILRN